MNTMNDGNSFVIARSKDYYKKPLMFLFASVVVFIILQMVFVAEIFVIPDEILETNLFIMIVYLIASLASLVIFIASLALFITALIVSLPRKLKITEGYVTYHGLSKTITIPRNELAAVRFSQESSDDIKHNIGTLCLRSERKEIINFGRIDNLDAVSVILRKYVSDSNFNAVEALNTKLN